MLTQAVRNFGKSASALRAGHKCSPARTRNGFQVAGDATTAKGGCRSASGHARIGDADGNLTLQDNGSVVWQLAGFGNEPGTPLGDAAQARRRPSPMPITIGTRVGVAPTPAYPRDHPHRQRKRYPPLTILGPPGGDGKRPLKCSQVGPACIIREFGHAQSLQLVPANLVHSRQGAKP